MTLKAHSAMTQARDRAASRVSGELVEGALVEGAVTCGDGDRAIVTEDAGQVVEHAMVGSEEQALIHCTRFPLAGNRRSGRTLVDSVDGWYACCGREGVIEVVIETAVFEQEVDGR